MSKLDKSSADLQLISGLSRREFVAVPLALAAGITGCATAESALTENRKLRTKMLPAEDRLDIQDLFARYAWNYDCGDEEGFLANFLPDATVIGIDKSYQGTEAIRAWFKYLIALRTQEGDDWLHDAYHHRFIGDRGSCIVYSYATHFNSNMTAKTLGVRSAGYFVSECVRMDDTWLFRKHSVNRWDRQQLPWNKPLPWQV